MESARRRELFLSTSAKRKEAPTAAVPVSSYPNKKNQKRYDTRGSRKAGETAGKNDGEASGSGVRCYKCGKTGHVRRECPDRDTVGGVVCFECGKVGHVRRDFPKVKHG